MVLVRSVASWILLGVSEWLEAGLMGRRVESWSSQQIPQTGSRAHAGEWNLLYAWCAEYREAMKRGEMQLNLGVSQTVVAVPPACLKQAPVLSCFQFCGGSLDNA